MHINLGYTLKQHRLACGLTRFEVAQRTGFSLSYIIAIEEGGAVSDNAINDLLRLYGVSACIRDAVSDYDAAMAVGDMSGRELA